MRRVITTSLLVAGLVVGGAAPSLAGKPVSEGNDDYTRTGVINPDGTCIFTVTLGVYGKKPATAWYYSIAPVGEAVVDDRYRLLDPQLADGNVVTFTILEGEAFAYAFAPVVNKKVLPAETTASSYDNCSLPSGA